MQDSPNTDGSCRSGENPIGFPPSKVEFQLDTPEPWVAGRSSTVTCVASDAKPKAVIRLFKGSFPNTASTYCTPA
ncbi:hypothetical protein DPEC_G00145500 [Dallia pectoralis]|uniref:Uncharacterized protein n=1 Tax=Dallia pectoralis TaxID=75939 RepID=A0ACC2GNS6_DALPE|nr:hypothetical protein DPEC_G00145500 [Dallia pectoralis]